MLDIGVVFDPGDYGVDVVFGDSEDVLGKASVSALDVELAKFVD